jgi:DNA-binding response OmpR family regulator
MNNHLSQHILVVEDDEDIRRICVKILTDSGYQVATAEDGKAAWKMLQAAGHDPCGFDLLITDNQMPQLSGVELVKRLRAADMNLPVVMASGTVPDNTGGLHLAAILPKPFMPDQLLQVVGEVLHWSTVMVNSRADHLSRASDGNAAVPGELANIPFFI